MTTNQTAIDDWPDDEYETEIREKKAELLRFAELFRRIANDPSGEGKDHWYSELGRITLAVMEYEAQSPLADIEGWLRLAGTVIGEIKEQSAA